MVEVSSSVQTLTVTLQCMVHDKVNEMLGVATLSLTLGVEGSLGVDQGAGAGSS